MSQVITVAVSGAAGQIGYAFLFRLASGHVFGPNVRIALKLLEVEVALPTVNGVMMELEDCAFPTLASVVATSDPAQAFDGANWVVLIGAAPRTAGMERSDLLAKNGGIFKVQGQALERAAKDVRIFVVGNPCNTNAYIAMQHAKNVPHDRFYAMTMLDQNRAVSQIAMRAEVPVTEVENMIIWGNHSSTQYPDFYHATVNSEPVIDVVDEYWLKTEFIPLIQQRGAAVIKARGASSAASAANGIVDSLRALTTDTPKGRTFSIVSCSKGQYGVDEGLMFSFPSRIEHGKFQVLEGWQHNEFGQAHFMKPLEELRAERDAVRALSLV